MSTKVDVIVHAPQNLEEAMELLDAAHKRIKRLKEANKSLQQQLRADALTGAPNARACKEHFHFLQGLGNRGTVHPYLVFVDVDHFKQVNDTYGHGVGDRVLCHVVQCLKGVLRHTDMVARLSGDEFIILVAESTPEDMNVLRGKVDSSFKEHPFLLESGEPLYIGVSLGVASILAGTTFESVKDDADTEMYKWKKFRQLTT